MNPITQLVLVELVHFHAQKIKVFEIKQLVLDLVNPALYVSVVRDFLDAHVQIFSETLCGELLLNQVVFCVLSSVFSSRIIHVSVGVEMFLGKI